MQNFNFCMIKFQLNIQKRLALDNLEKLVFWSYFIIQELKFCKIAQLLFASREENLRARENLFFR